MKGVPAGFISNVQNVLGIFVQNLEELFWGTILGSVHEGCEIEVHDFPIYFIALVHELFHFLYIIFVNVFFHLNRITILFYYLLFVFLARF